MGGLIFLAVLVVLLLVMSAWRVAKSGTVVVLAYQRGVRFKRGALDSVLEPGVYRTWRYQSITLVDMRLQVLLVPGQELLTTDGITLKITMGGEYKVVDAARYLTASVSSASALYQRAQEALRSAVGEAGFEELLRSRAVLGERVRARMQGRTEDLGIEIAGLEVRDILLTGELRKAFAQAATAQKDAAAALERARGETASLRSLANAARLMEELPSLVQLRAIQAAEGSRGNTIVVGVPVEEAARRRARSDDPTA